MPLSDLRRRILASEWALVVFRVSILISLLQGLAIAVVRVKEPVYFFILKREMWSWFGALVESPADSNDIRVNSVNSLMNAQLSVDLVYAILHTITENTVGIPKREDGTRLNWLVYQKYDFTNKNDFLIESMVINNPKKM